MLHLQTVAILLLTYFLTYSMEQIPSWESNRFPASQEFPRILWNPKVHYRIHKSPPSPSICEWLVTYQGVCDEDLFARRPTPELEDHPLWVVN